MRGSKTRKQAEWFEDDSFWIEMYPVMFSEKRFEAAGGQVEKILELSGVEAESVLDLYCGPGRHAVAFAKKGMQVTGVDRTPFLLNKAKELAKDEQVAVEWILISGSVFGEAGWELT